MTTFAALSSANRKRNHSVESAELAAARKIQLHAARLPQQQYALAGNTGHHLPGISPNRRPHSDLYGADTRTGTTGSHRGPGRIRRGRHGPASFALAAGRLFAGNSRRHIFFLKPSLVPSSLVTAGVRNTGLLAFIGFDQLAKCVLIWLV